MYPVDFYVLDPRVNEQFVRHREVVKTMSPHSMIALLATKFVTCRHITFQVSITVAILAQGTTQAPMRRRRPFLLIKFCGSAMMNFLVCGLAGFAQVDYLFLKGTLFFTFHEFEHLQDSEGIPMSSRLRFSHAKNNELQLLL